MNNSFLQLNYMTFLFRLFLKSNTLIAKILLIICFSFNFEIEAKTKKRRTKSPIVLQTKRIDIEGLKGVFNPSIIKIDDGFLLTFRHCLAPTYSHVSYIGIIKLDNNLNPTSKPQLLNTRNDQSATPSQAEDARIFTCKGKIYVIYNDNIENINPSAALRRDMFLAEVVWTGNEFILGQPIKLIHQKKYNKVKWQKNWVPFVWNSQILLAYSINAHEVLVPNLHSGVCKVLATSSIKKKWPYGELRGGTPALLVDGEYLAFFHSSAIRPSTSSGNIPMHHYYMGAYTFSKEPPFDIKKISQSPIIADGFYTKSNYDKRVVFPGGFAISDNKFYVAYGKDDSEVWVAIMDKRSLFESLKPVKRKHH